MVKETRFYELLQVDPTADAATIKKSYRLLARKFHPDKNPNAGDIFKEISMVYDVLSKPDKRKLYDAAGELGIKGGKTEQPPHKSNEGSEHSDDSCTESDFETDSDECDEEANDTFRKRFFFSGPFVGGFRFTFSYHSEPDMESESEPDQSESESDEEVDLNSEPEFDHRNEKDSGVYNDLFISSDSNSDNDSDDESSQQTHRKFDNFPQSRTFHHSQNLDSESDDDYHNNVSEDEKEHGDIESGSDIDTEPELLNNSDIDSESDPEFESCSKSDQEVDSDPDSGVYSDPYVEPQLGETVILSDSESEKEFLSDSESEKESDGDSENDVDFCSDDESEDYGKVSSRTRFPQDPVLDSDSDIEKEYHFKQEYKFQFARKGMQEHNGGGPIRGAPKWRGRNRKGGW